MSIDIIPDSQTVFVRYGVDVSSYQEDIDWAKAKDDGG